MKELVFEDFRILQNPHKTSIHNNNDFSDTVSLNTLRFHKSIPGYKETPLVSLDSTAKKNGVAAILVKDESERFGLKAFKGLGGSYAMFRIMCRLFNLDSNRADYSIFQQPEIQQKCESIVFATATDGNHGKGVSWASKIFGCKARVFMPSGTLEVRRKAIEDAGNAKAEITDFNYDQTVDYVAKLARENGWVLIQDTAWDGYEEIPKWIIEGYLTMGREIAEQIGHMKPTHVFLQAGVGSMAGGIAAYMLDKYKQNKPSIVIVEPEEAACIYLSAKHGDGMMHSVTGNPRTIMAGLNCGTPCKTIWPILRDETDLYCSCKDIITEQGMYAYAHPLLNDKKIISGESGAVTYGLLQRILKDDTARKLFHIGPSSVILLINTEGNTDPEGYQRVMDSFSG